MLKKSCEKVLKLLNDVKKKTKLSTGLIHIFFHFPRARYTNIKGKGVAK